MIVLFAVQIGGFNPSNRCVVTLNLDIHTDCGLLKTFLNLENTGFLIYLGWKRQRELCK